MQDNPFTFLGQAISQLLSSNSPALQATGLDMFRSLAVILIAWFGIKSALSASQGHGGFHFGKFADLILLISFGLGMLTYYSTPIPGVGYSFSDLITKEALSISGQIESDTTQQIATTVTTAEQQTRSASWQLQHSRRSGLPDTRPPSGCNASRILRRHLLRVRRRRCMCTDRSSLYPLVYRAQDGLALLGMVESLYRL